MFPQPKFYQGLLVLAFLLNGKKIIEAENGAAHNKGVRLINLERNERLQLNVFSKNVGTLMSDVSAFFDLMLFVSYSGQPNNPLLLFLINVF